MDLINWNDTYLVGIQPIDNQHQKLVEIINKVAKSIKLGNSKESIQLIHELVSFIKTHFKFEEELMAKYNYNDYEHHRYEHEKLNDEIKVFYDDLQNGFQVLNSEIMYFLRNWLMDHILVKDKKLGKFLQSQGMV
jgi:hemerythrin